jgi:hypothetical protein
MILIESEHLTRLQTNKSAKEGQRVHTDHNFKRKNNALKDLSYW